MTNHIATFGGTLVVISSIALLLGLGWGWYVGLGIGVLIISFFVYWLIKIMPREIDIDFDRMQREGIL